MSSRLIALMRADLLTLSRRRWVVAVALVGAALAVVIGVAQSGTAAQRDIAALLALGGLIVALGLGAPALVSDLQSGAFGMVGGAGASITDIAWGRLISRTLALAAIFALWGLAAQIGRVIGGAGLDADLALHTLYTGETLLLVLIAAAGAATLLGAVAGGLFGLAMLITAQAVVNLKAASDQGFIGSGNAAIDLAYWALPRTVVSPMLADLQAADEAGAVAPQVEINGNLVTVPAAELDTVLWTLAWCGLFLGIAVFGLKRREI